MSNLSPGDPGADTMLDIASMTGKTVKTAALVLLAAGAKADVAIGLLRESTDPGVWDECPFDGTVLIEQAIREAETKLWRAIDDAAE